MWMKQKTSKEIPFEEFARKHKNTKFDALLDFPANKEVAKLYRAKKPLPKGTVVWLLDPKVTVYITTLPGGKKHVSSAKEYKAAVAKIHKMMDFALKTYETYLETMDFRVNEMQKAYDKHYIVSFFTSNWVGSKGDRPDKQAKASAAAVRRLRAVVTGRDYANFEAATKAAHKAAMAYRQGIDDWINQHSGSSENFEMALTVVRDGGFMTVGVLAMTVAAPATALGTAGYAAAIGGGTSVLQSSADATGRFVAGDKLTFKGTAEKILLDGAKGAGWGLVGAGLSAGLAKFVTGPLASAAAKRFGSSGFVKAMLGRITGSKWYVQFYRRVFQKELEAFEKEAVKALAAGTYGPANEVTGAFIKAAREKAFQQFQKATLTVLTGEASKTIIKVFQEVMTGPKGSTYLRYFMSKKAPNITGKVSEKQLAGIIAEDLSKDDVAQSIFEEIVSRSLDQIAEKASADIRAELRSAAKELEKKNKR